MSFDINDFDDPLVWDLICDGNTKGVFQLESSLGKHWAKEVRPRNIKELAALISLIRPGCLKARDADGKSMTQVYADRKAGKPNSPVQYLHESLEPILKETYGVLVYQEQSMMIAQQLAGFNLKEADALRKAIGKKKADLMEEVKKTFLAGTAKKAIVTNEIAEELFSWIEKSNRYAFNKSHAVSYAINAYWSAYCKAYRIEKFFNTYLNRADRKPKPDIEKKQLITDAKRCGIDVLPPRLQHLTEDFSIGGFDPPKLYYGLRHIKNVGSKEALALDCDNKGEFVEYNWMDCLIKLIHEKKLNKRSVISLISVGAFNGPNNRESRQRMLYEFDSWKQLSAREQQTIVDNYDKHKPKSLSKAIKLMLTDVKVNSRRLPTVEDIINSLENPFYDLDDKAETMASDEEKFMSCALTCSKIDGIDLNMTTYACKDIANGAITGKANIAAEVVSVRTYKTKRGKNPGQLMAFLCVEDGTGTLDSVTVFPECYEKHKDLLVESNTLLIIGEISKKDRCSLVANQFSQI